MHDLAVTSPEPLHVPKPTMASLTAFQVCENLIAKYQGKDFYDLPHECKGMLQKISKISHELQKSDANEISKLNTRELIQCLIECDPLLEPFTNKNVFISLSRASLVQFHNLGKRLCELSSKLFGDSFVLCDSVLDRLFSSMDKHHLAAIGSAPSPTPVAFSTSPISHDDIEFQQKIGCGASATVYLVTYRNGAAALKVFKPTFNFEKIQAEVQVMQQLRHENLVPLYGTWLCDGHHGLVMEYFPHQSLRDVLANPLWYLPWSRRYQFALDVAHGVDYLHSQSPVILHRDIKSFNVLATRDFLLKLSDFGLCKFSCSGTPAWMAPETSDSTKLDVYSFAVLLWEIATKQLPYENTDMDRNAIRDDIRAGNRLTIPSDCPPEFSSLIGDCWKQNPNDRPNFSQIIRRLNNMLKPFLPVPPVLPVAPSDENGPHLAIQQQSLRAFWKRYCSVGAVSLEYFMERLCKEVENVNIAVRDRDTTANLFSPERYSRLTDLVSTDGITVRCSTIAWLFDQMPDLSVPALIEALLDREAVPLGHSNVFRSVGDYFCFKYYPDSSTNNVNFAVGIETDFDTIANSYPNEFYVPFSLPAETSTDFDNKARYYLTVSPKGPKAFAVIHEVQSAYFCHEKAWFKYRTTVYDAKATGKETFGTFQVEDKKNDSGQFVVTNRVQLAVEKWVRYLAMHNVQEFIPIAFKTGGEIPTSDFNLQAWRSKIAF